MMSEPQKTEKVQQYPSIFHGKMDGPTVGPKKNPQIAQIPDTRDAAIAHLPLAD
jgi:hypothetical protein